MTNKTKNELDAIVELIQSTNLSREKLLCIQQVVSRQMQSIDDAEKVKIYGLRCGDTRRFYMTPAEVKAELLSEMENTSEEDMEYVDIAVESYLVPEVDLSEYIGKLQIL